MIYCTTTAGYSSNCIAHCPHYNSNGVPQRVKAVISDSKICQSVPNTVSFINSNSPQYSRPCNDCINHGMLEIVGIIVIIIIIIIIIQKWCHLTAMTMHSLTMQASHVKIQIITVICDIKLDQYMCKCACLNGLVVQFMHHAQMAKPAPIRVYLRDWMKQLGRSGFLVHRQCGQLSRAHSLIQWLLTNMLKNLWLTDSVEYRYTK